MKRVHVRSRGLLKDLFNTINVLLRYTDANKFIIAVRIVHKVG